MKSYYKAKAEYYKRVMELALKDGDKKKAKAAEIDYSNYMGRLCEMEEKSA